jgi:hypothetical protein
MKGLILLDKWEVNGQNRVEEAEELILQLPKDNPARNAWLFKYGISEEAVQLRATNNPSVNFNEMFRKCDTGSLNTPYLDSRIITVIADLIEVQTEQEEPLKDEPWFPTPKDFRFRSPMGGFYAMHFFPNGLGVQVRKIGENKFLAFSLKLLIGTPEDYKEYINLELNPQNLGYDANKLQKQLEKIRTYKLDK